MNNEDRNEPGESSIRIITNNRWRTLLDWNELTPKEQEEFDWIEDPEENPHEFFRYRGQVYCTADFLVVSKGYPFYDAPGKWCAYRSDSFFSAVLIRYHPDGNDEVVVGLALM